MLELKVTLRISSKEHTLLDLERILGKPSNGYSKGDIYSRNKIKREQSLWALESSSLPNADFESHLNEIIDFLDNKKKKLSDLRGKCELDIFCMLSSDNGQGGAVLSSQVMKKISQYRLDIILDVYAE